MQGVTTTRSDNVGTLMAALAAAQGQFGAVEKDSKNTFYNSRYASLASVMDEIRTPLAANGIAMVFGSGAHEPSPCLVPKRGERDASTVTTMDGIRILCWVELHCGSEWLRVESWWYSPRTDPQGLGGVLTYARRYMVCALLGLAPGDVDDDAQSVSAVNQPAQKRLPLELSQFLGSFGWAAGERAARANTLLGLAGSSLHECTEDHRIAANVLGALRKRIAELAAMPGQNAGTARDQIWAEAIAASQLGVSESPAATPAVTAPANASASPNSTPPWKSWGSAPLIEWLEPRVPADKNGKERAVKALLSAWQLQVSDFKTMSSGVANDVLSSLQSTLGKLVSGGMTEDAALKTMISAAERSGK